MSHNRMVVLPRFSLKCWRVIGAWELGQSQNRTEERSSGRSESEQREKFWQGLAEGQLGLFFDWGQVEGEKAFGV
jgi:hypothetical protein